MKCKILVSIPQELRNTALDVSTDRKKRSLPGKTLAEVYAEAIEKGLRVIQSEGRN